MIKQLIRFDWAIKRILRNKSNFDILEGFLSELIGEDVKIKHIADSESNKMFDEDKHNRVDILVENMKNELVIIEIQNSKEYDYFHRMLYGTSKAITEHITQGKPYSEVKKIISITIAYFDLGQGEDYVYHGTNIFKGIHKGDILTLSEKQVQLYEKQEVHQIYPEYWVIKVSQFNDLVQDKLDEWIYFLKNSEVKSTFSAKGLKEAGNKLKQMNLSEKEQKEYKYYLKYLHDIASEQQTKMIDEQDKIDLEKKIRQDKLDAEEKGRQEGIQEGEEKKEIDAVIGMFENNIPISIIAKSLKISEDRVTQIIEKYK